MPLTLMVYVVPDPLTTAVSVPPAVDAERSTSAFVNPVTDALNTTLKTIGDALVGSACVGAWLIVTLGGAGAL